MLPHALYGDRSWQDALKRPWSWASSGMSAAAPGRAGLLRRRDPGRAGALGSRARSYPGGKVRPGPLACRLRPAPGLRGRSALSLEERPRQAAEALVLICPAVSRTMEGESALEVAALEVHGAREVFRLAVHGLAGDWRCDPGVTVQTGVHGRAGARRSIPCILDARCGQCPGASISSFAPGAFGPWRRPPRRGSAFDPPHRAPQRHPLRRRGAAAVEAAVGAVAEFAPTLTAVTGDLTLNGLPREFASARDWLARLPGPRMVTPGNHDTPYWNLILRSFTPFDRYRRYIGPPGAAASTGRGSPPAASTAPAGSAAAQLVQGRDRARPTAADRLGRAFPRQTEAVRLPSPLDRLRRRTGDRRRPPGGASGGDIGPGRRRTDLTGHVHIPFVMPHTGGAPGCYALGAGTLSVRTRGAPASFSTIVADDTAFEVTALAWTGGRFETMKSWRLPRRGGAELH